MSEKDSVSSQDTPAVFRALGTLALAAATAVAIKWFISRDKTEKAEDKESKFQCNQDPIEDGQSPLDQPKADEEKLANNVKARQVSDEQAMTVLAFNYFSPGSLKSALETSGPTTVYVKEDGKCLTDHKKLLDNSSPVFCKRNYVAGPQNTLQSSEGANVRISALPATVVDDKTNDTQNQASCFTQTYDKTSYERSQEEQLNSGTSSSNGECTDVMNVKYLGCIGDDNMVSGICLKHKTVKVGLDEDHFNMDNYKNNGNLSCDTDINTANSTKPCVQNDDNMSGSISNKNADDNTKEELRKRVNIMNTCAPGLPELQEGVNTLISSHEVLTRCHQQRTIYTTFNMQDILQTVDVIQEAQQTTITTSKEDTVLTSRKSRSQDENFNNNHITCTQRTSIEHRIHASTEDIVEAANENPKSSSMSSIAVFEEHMVGDENNGKLFHSVNALHNYHKGNHDKELPSRDKQINGGSENHIQLCLPETDVMDERKLKNTKSHHTNHVVQWNTTTVYNSTEYIDLMYPLDFHALENSITPLTENDNGQPYIENTHSLLSDISMSQINNNLDGDRSFECSTFHNITHEKLIPSTTTSKILCDLSTLKTFNSSMVTKTETQSIKSKSNEQNHDVIYDWHKNNSNFFNMDRKEFCAVITNGYFSRYQKQVGTNGVDGSSEKYKPEEGYDSNQQFGTSKTLSKFLQNTMTLPERSSSWKPFSNHTSSCLMMDISKRELTMQEIKKDLNLAKDQESVQESGSLTLTENLRQINLDSTDFSSNDVCPEQSYFPSSTSNLFQNEKEDKLLQSTDQEKLSTVESDTQSHSRERIMSTIAETPDLILPEYQSVSIPESKKPVMTKSCDNIYSGPSFEGSALKNKAQSMLCLLTEYYTTKLHSLENGPLEEVARGCFIRIPKGFHNIREGMRFQLTLGNCLELLRVARKNSVPELLKAVYTLISDNYLNVLKNSAIYGQLTGSEREKILQLRMRGKLSLCMIETQSIFGLNKNISRSEDMSPDQPKDQLYSLDMEANQWKRVTNIPEEACLKGCSICSMHNYLFIAGGIQKTKNGLFCSNKLFCYNPLTDIWTQLTPMNQARSQLKLVPLDGYLYAIGGECLHTMERYDPRSNKWTFVASLPKGSFAVAHEAAACGGEIYISGGHLFYRLLKYNPVRNLWEECPFNASKGRSCDMVAVGHILYRFDMHKDSAVHIFKYNTTAKVWSEYTTTFPNSKVPFRCAVLDGSIYCLNREMTARFSVQEEKPMFESALFSKVPTKGVGYPCPVVLSLQGSLSQTSV